MDKQRSYTPILIGLALAGIATTAGILWYRSKYLSKDFLVKDLSRSAKAKTLGITEQFNPPKSIIKSGRKFAKVVLQPTRNTLGYPIFASSWYRHPLTNKAVGGVEDSRHLKAEAADLRTVIDGVFRNDLLAKAVLNSKVPFTKMILEYGTPTRPLVIHLAYTPGDNRQLIFRKPSKGAYVPISHQDVQRLA